MSERVIQISELAELNKDKRRLDYLDAMERAHIRHVNEHLEREGEPQTGDQILFVAMDGATCWGATMREAIDKAMAHDGYYDPGRPEKTSERPAKQTH